MEELHWAELNRQRRFYSGLLQPGKETGLNSGYTKSSWGFQVQGQTGRVHIWKITKRNWLDIKGGGDSWWTDLAGFLLKRGSMDQRLGLIKRRAQKSWVEFRQWGHSCQGTALVCTIFLCFIIPMNIPFPNGGYFEVFIVFLPLSLLKSHVLLFGV